MNFYEWLYIKKGYAITTAKLYEYHIRRREDAVTEYENCRNIPTKRIIYSAYKLYCEFIGIEFTLGEIPKKMDSKITRVLKYYEYQTIADDYLSHNENFSINGRMIALFAFIYGMRISEILNLKRSDISENGISIKGKGGKRRMIPISKKLEHTLKNYEGYIVSWRGIKISYSQARLMLEDIKRKNNLDPNITWHSFRHGFAVRHLNSGMSIYDISKLLGHSSIQTTTIYLRYNLKKVNTKMIKLGLFA